MNMERSHGLVFRWRGGHPSNTGGYVVSFIIVALCFVFAFTLLDVSVRKRQFNTQRTARVIWVDSSLLNENEHWMIHQRSWKASEDTEVLSRLQKHLQLELYGTTYNKPQFLPLPENTTVFSLPEVFPAGIMHLPKVTPPTRKRVEPSHHYVVHPSIVSGGSSENTLLPYLPYQGQIKQGLLGHSTRYLLKISKDGFTKQATILKQGEEMLGDVQPWLESLRFNHADEARAVVIEVTVKERNTHQGQL